MNTSLFRRFAAAVLAAMSIGTAADVCNHLTATGIGQTSIKYPNVGATGSCANGVYTLDAYGHDFYWGWDRGGFAYLEIQGNEDFRFSADIQDFEAGSQSEKIGINVREGLVGNDRSIQLRWDGFFSGNWDNAQVSWLYRFQPGVTNSEFCSAADRFSCFREGGTEIKEFKGSTLVLERKNMRYQMFVNGTRVGESETFVLGTQKAYVGLIASFGGGEFTHFFTRKAVFENIECTGAPCPGGATSIRSSENSNRDGWTATFMRGQLRLAPPDAEALASAVSVQAYDASGRLVAKSIPRPVAGSLLLELEPPGPGMYHVRVLLRDGTIHRVPFAALY